MSTLTNAQHREMIEELKEIKAQILEALDRAEWLIRQSDNRNALASAKAYWLAHAKIAITKDHDYLGGSMCTMEDTIEELEHFDDENEED